MGQFLVSKLSSLLINSLAVNQSKQIHAQIIANGLGQLNSKLINQLLLSSSTFSTPTFLYLQKVLQSSLKSNALSWGYTIRHLSQHGQFKEAFSLYVQMHDLGLCPSSFATSSALKACARIEHKLGGVSIHTHVFKYGFCECVYVETAVVDMYGKFGEMGLARKVFDEMPERNVVSWNSLLNGYLNCGDLDLARQLFDEMVEKDVVSWNSMVSGYAKMGFMEEASSLFQHMPERNVASWNSMISGYVECGKIELARSFFDVMPQRNNVSWITMISGYSKCGNINLARELFDQIGKRDLYLYNAIITCYSRNSRPKEAIELFNQMLSLDVDIQPDKMTLASILSACSQLGDLRFGTWLESYMRKIGIEMDDHLVTALMDLYAKCGSIDKAYELFHGLRKKDLVAYTTMILGFGINGKPINAVHLFEEMVDAHIRPNLITYTGILTSYNHAGLVEQGYRCFVSMMENGIVPSADHYAIMVDLLGRAGRLEEASKLIKSMPMQPHAEVWGALLLACKLHCNVEFGEIAAQNCFDLEPETTAYYSLLANIYADVGRWDDAKMLRKKVMEKGMAKIPGSSWVESC